MSSKSVTRQVSGSFSHHFLDESRGQNGSVNASTALGWKAACISLLQSASAPLSGSRLLSFAAASSVSRLICCLFQCFRHSHCHVAPSLYGNPRQPSINDERLLSVRFPGLTSVYVRALMLKKSTNLWRIAPHGGAYLFMLSLKASEPLDAVPGFRRQHAPFRYHEQLWFIEAFTPLRPWMCAEVSGDRDVNLWNGRLHGLGLFVHHIPLMLNWIETWGIWRPSQTLCCAHQTTPEPVCVFCFVPRCPPERGHSRWGTLLTSKDVHLQQCSTPPTHSNIHTDGRTRGFPAEHCLKHHTACAGALSTHNASPCHVFPEESMYTHPASTHVRWKRT